jgi:dolichyl-diphosphooligosaccharide--protein glycosyltransferase
MEETSEHIGWWQRHGLAVLILLVAASISFILRTIYAYELIQQCNILYCFAGGSDSFYHARVMTYIIQNHSNLIKDSLLNYPLGINNPREPLFDWMNAVLGIIFAPLFGGNAVTAGMWFLEMQPPFWAAAGVLPVYLIGKEVSSRRMGLVAALIYPLLVGNMESTVATYANYLPFYAFFVFTTLWVYLHAVKLSGTRRWVESYASPRSIWQGFKDFARVERQSFNWAVFGGVAMGATLFAWQGYTYVLAVIVAFLVITLIIERLRKADSFGAYVVTFIIGTIGFLMAMPYYYIQGEFGYWFTVPILIFYGALLAMLPFLMLRDTPWLFSMGVLLASLVAAVGGLFLYNKGEFNALITGQGYFIKNLIYSTVAEAQAPSFDSLIVSYGPVSFFLTFAGLGLFAFYLYRHRFKREHIFMVVLGVVGIYLPIEAAKFFLVGSPLFAILPAEVLVLILDRMGYPEMRRTIASLSDRGGRTFALRKGLKVRHFVVVLVTIAVLLPNVWYAVDAAIPYNEKSTYNEQIYNTLPPSLRTTPSDASSFYLGAAGIDTDTPSQYDENGYNWLATQDTQLIPADKPAFVSWWDYGFQAVDQGLHPTVADNFQDGIDPSGHFLLAQNESLAIAVLSTTLLYTEQVDSGKPYLPAQLNTELAADGLNVTALHNYMVNTSRDIPIVINNPSIYGQVNANNLDSLNAMYYTTDSFIASTLNENGVVAVYQTLQSYTGWSIRYAMTDSRLFPESGSSTGIYYAPVDLTDGVIGSGGIPTYYFTVTETDAEGNVYPLGEMPNGDTAVSSAINYNSPFYNSMIYHIFVGYNGSQIDVSPSSNGIPGIDSSMSQYPVEPGWMMQHFMMGYRTAYYCPLKNYTSSCFDAINLNLAQAYQKAGTGTVDTSTNSYYSGGETILEYYPGAAVSGAVVLSNGSPVPGVHVTMLDSWGIPHMVATTNKYGAFKLLAPPGNDTIAVSYGGVSGLTQTGSTEVTTYNITVSQQLAYSYGSPPIYVPITLKPAMLSGVLYWNTANSSSYVQSTDVPITGARMTLSNGALFNESSTTDILGSYAFRNLSPGQYNLSVTVGKSTFSLGTVSISSGSTQTKDEGLKVSAINGKVMTSDGTPTEGALVTLTSILTGTRQMYSNSSGSYSFSVLPPDVYTVSASTSTGMTSTSTQVRLFTEGQNTSVNLTVITPVIASLRVTYGGFPVPNIPVRFSPLETDTNNSIVVSTGPDGFVNARLVPGLWSVYALGAINGTWLSALANINLYNGTTVYSQGLQLSMIQVLQGHVYGRGSSEPQGGVMMLIQSSSGAVMQAATNASGAYRLLLPKDTYAVIATYSPSSAAPMQAAIASAYVSGTTRLDLGLTNAVTFSTKIGYHSYSGSFVPLTGSILDLAFNGVTVHLVSGLNGTVNLTMPEENTSYTLTASNYGFAQNVTVLPDQEVLLKTTQIRLDPIPVNIQVGVNCGACTSSSPPILNFTATSPSAANVTATAVLKNGTYAVNTFLSPGDYSIGGYANRSNPLLASAGNITVSIPVGSQPIQLPTVNFYPLNAYNGTLVLSNGSVFPYLSETTVHLENPTYGNFSYNGLTFTNSTTRIRVPTGYYTVWIIGQSSSQTYSYIGNISFSPGGVLPKMKLTPAKTLQIAFSTSVGGNLHANLNVTLVDVNATANAAKLRFSTDLSGMLTPTLPNGTYEVSVNNTVLLNLSGIEHYVTLYIVNYTCPIPSSQTTCSIPLSSTSARTLVTGYTYLSGKSISQSGTVTIAPVSSASGKPKTLEITGGSFAILLYPGKYNIYTVIGGSGVPLVNLTQVTVPYARQGLTLTLGMQPGWIQSVDILSPPGLPMSASASLNVTLQGTTTSFLIPDLAVNSPASVTLYPGTWLLDAESFASPYGSAVHMSSNMTVTTSTANGAIQVQLQPAWTRTASVTVVGPSSATVTEGGNASFTMVVNDTGNAYEKLTFGGAPQSWTFHFNPANVTLTPLPGQTSASIEASVSIPTNVLTTQSSGTLEAFLAGTSTNIATAPISIHVLPVHQVSLAITQGSMIVGNHTLTIGFQASATGNSVEQVSVSVQNGAVLNQEGWSYTVTQSFSGLTPGNPPVKGTIVLTAIIGGATLPPQVILLATDSAAPGTHATLNIPVSQGAITIPGTLVLTGPNMGTPGPDWFPTVALVGMVAPAVAILAYAFTYRWWKTRRWVRR